MKGKNLLLLGLLAVGVYLWYKSRKAKQIAPTTGTAQPSEESEIAAAINNDAGVA